MILRSYYTLLIRYDGRWCNEYGDPDSEVVQAEYERQKQIQNITDLTIIKTPDSNSAIRYQIEKLNEN